MHPQSASNISLNTAHGRQQEISEIMGSSRLGSYHQQQHSMDFQSNSGIQHHQVKGSTPHNMSLKNSRMPNMQSGTIHMQSYSSQPVISDPLLRLEDSFRQAMDELLRDPLMDCFKNSRESQNFMLDRAEEIVVAALKSSAVQLVNDLHNQLDQCQHEIKVLSESSKIMTAVPSSKSMGSFGSTKHPSQAMLIQGADLTPAEEQATLTAKLQQEVDSLTARLGSELELKEGLQTELTACKAQLETLTKELQTLQLDERQKVYKQTLEEKDELSTQLKTTTEKAAQQDAKLHHLKKENEKLIENFEKANAQLEKVFGEKQSLEKQLKKSVFDHNERKEFLERQVSKLTEEVNFLKGSVTQARLDGVSAENLSNDTALKESLLVLERKFKEVKDKYNAKSKQYEELEFDHNQVKGTIGGLKSEIGRLTESSLEDRKDKHRYEVQLIEARNKVNEVTLILKQREETIATNEEQISSLQSELEKVQESLKIEKRRLVALERESEQYIFTTKTKEKEQSELIQSLSKQVSTLKSENQHVLIRLDTIAAEGSSKLSKETKENQHLSQKLKLAESREADLAMHLEDLAKKTEFYRDQLKKGQGKEKIENIKEKLKTLLLGVKQLKERHSAEIFQSKQDYNALCSLLLRLSEDYLFRVKTRSLSLTRTVANQSPIPFKQPPKEPLQESLKVPTRHSDFSHLEEIFRKSMENITRGLPKNPEMLERLPVEKQNMSAKKPTGLAASWNSSILSTPKPNDISSKENHKPLNRQEEDFKLELSELKSKHALAVSDKTASKQFSHQQTSSNQYNQPEDHFSLGMHNFSRDRNSFGVQQNTGNKQLSGQPKSVVSLSVAPTPVKTKIEAVPLSAKSQAKDSALSISGLSKFEGFPLQESKLSNLTNSIFPLRAAHEAYQPSNVGFGSLGIAPIPKPATERGQLQWSPPFGNSNHNSLHSATAGFGQILGHSSPGSHKLDSRLLGSDLRRIEEESEEIARRIHALRAKDHRPARHLDYED